MSDNRIVDCEQNGVVNAFFACQNVTNSKKRIGYIDSLKGFLILCVALLLDGFFPNDIAKIGRNNLLS